MLWNIEGAVKTLDSSCHDFSTHHIVALTETLSTTGVLSSDRTWINSVARKNSIGRPSGGLAIGLSDAVAWREKTCFLSNIIIAVDTVRFVFCVCYFQPKTAIIDIIDDFARALSSISPCTKPLIVYFAKGEPRNVEYCKVFLWKYNGCSGLGNCRMLKILSIAFCVIGLITC